MHIVDGILPAGVVVSGGAIAVAGTALGLKAMRAEDVPKVAVLAATFLVVSMIRLPLGPASVHLALVGLIGLVLGWAAFPALLAALLLEAVFFGFGGITTLGVNLLNVALPAVAVHYLLAPRLASSQPNSAWAWGAAAGVFGMALMLGLEAATLALAGEAFLPAAQLLLASHMPIVALEGILTGAAVHLAVAVRPDLVAARRGGS